MSENKPPGGWLRENAEKYLLEAAADDMANRYPDCTSGAYREKGVLPFLWRRIFVPLYLAIPWKIRRRIILMTSYSRGDRPKWKKFD